MRCAAVRLACRGLPQARVKLSPHVKLRADQAHDDRQNPNTLRQPQRGVCVPVGFAGHGHCPHVGSKVTEQGCFVKHVLCAPPRGVAPPQLSRCSAGILPAPVPMEDQSAVYPAISRRYNTPGVGLRRACWREDLFEPTLDLRGPVSACPCACPESVSALALTAEGKP